MKIILLIAALLIGFNASVPASAHGIVDQSRRGGDGHDGR